jgi:MoaA/NifB/PqqE/SkfB family radical SAM enzyme
MIPSSPSDAIVAVTLNCNSRCVMCDIWKNEIQGEMRPSEYEMLPISLREINITGGEPFLREDLPEILTVIRRRLPGVRLIVSSHGFMTERIRRLAKELKRVVPDLALRISIDGLEPTHQKVRGIPGGFAKDMESLAVLRESGFNDLGIAMTVMKENVREIQDVHRLSERLGVDFSITIATESDVYFGKGKDSLRPDDGEDLRKGFEYLIGRHFRSFRPRSVARAWFEKSLYDFTRGQGRALACDAGSGFFYLDSMANVYACHILSSKLGNLRETSFDEIWEGSEAERYRRELAGCEKCWMVCTAKSAMRRNLVTIGLEATLGKAKAHLGLS